MKKILKNQNICRPCGVGALEVIVAIAIGTIIFLVVTEVIISNNILYRSFSSTIEVNQSASFPLERVRALVTGAKRVLANKTISGTTYVSNKDTLVFELRSVDANQNIIVGSYDAFAITRDPLNTSKLVSIGAVATGSARNGLKTELASLVDEVIFRYNNPTPSEATLVDLFLAVKQTSAPSEPRAISGLTFKLRNK